MTIAFKLPDLGENIEKGDVIGVLVSVGDTITENQPLLELETDKATIEVPSPVSGVVKEIHIKAGDQAKVGQTIFTLETADGQAPPQPTATPEATVTPESATAPPPEPAAAPESAAAPPPEPATPPEPAAASSPEAAATSEPAAASPPEPAKPAPSTSTSLIEVKIPEMGDNVGTGEVINVFVSSGDTIEVEQTLLEVETDKATVEIPSSAGGVVKEVFIKVGDQVQAQQIILTVTGQAPTPAAAPPQAEKAEALAPPAQPAAPPLEPAKPVAEPQLAVAAPPLRRTPGKPAPAAPSVRRLARELGIDINEVPGSGPAGRISEKDVKNQVKRLNLEQKAAPAVAAASAVSPVAPPLPDFSKWGQVEKERMSGIRRATARQMSLAWNTIPHVTNFDKADITDLENLRKQYAKKAEAAGGKLTVTAILLKVAATALKHFPKMNASIDVANEQIIYKKYYHLGLAVDTDRGLLVPAIRNVDQKSIMQLSIELNEVAAKARDRKLTMDDMQGSTFTITNLGGIGGTNFTPIVNYPEVAILGVARGSREAIFREGVFEPRLMMPLALSYDHRLIDGADAARFLRWICETLEQPFILALEA